MRKDIIWDIFMKWIKEMDDDLVLSVRIFDR